MQYKPKLRLEIPAKCTVTNTKHSTIDLYVAMLAQAKGGGSGLSVADHSQYLNKNNLHFRNNFTVLFSHVKECLVDMDKMFDIMEEKPEVRTFSVL